MSTLNRMNLQDTIKKYVKTKQVIYKDGNIEVIEKDKDKADKIIWELAEHSPQIALQMMGGKS